MKIDEHGYLHIYSQLAWHDEAFIVGDSVALTNLRNAITEALETGSSQFESFVGDGEGFNIHVMNVADPAEFHKFVEPYTEEIARDYREGTVSPQDKFLSLKKPFAEK